MEDELLSIVKSGMAVSGASQEQVEHLVSQMITYAKANVQNNLDNATPDQFVEWLQNQDDKILNTMNDKGEN